MVAASMAEATLVEEDSTEEGALAV
jgi:hypothetical protein